jgi:hypothetical protein
LPIKLKSGLKVAGTLQIATHLDQSNYLPNQKQGEVNKYDMTVYTTQFQSSESCGTFQGFQWIHWIWLMNPIQDFQSRVTNWALVEILRVGPSPTPLVGPLPIFTYNIQDRVFQLFP